MDSSDSFNLRSIESLATAQFCDMKISSHGQFFDQSSQGSGNQIAKRPRFILCLPTPKSQKKVLLLRLEGPVIMLDDVERSYTFAAENSSTDTLVFHYFIGGQENECVVRKGARCFFSTVSKFYRVFLYSSLEKSVLKDHASAIGINTYVEGYIGGIDRTTTLEKIVRGSELQKDFNPKLTVMVDSLKEIVELNRANGILIDPISRKNQDSTFCELTKFLVFLSSFDCCTPILKYFKSYTSDGQVDSEIEQQAETAEDEYDEAPASDRSIRTKEVQNYNLSPMKESVDSSRKGSIKSLMGCRTNHTGNYDEISNNVSECYMPYVKEVLSCDRQTESTTLQGGLGVNAISGEKL